MIYVHLLGLIAKEAGKRRTSPRFDETIGERTSYTTKRRALIVKTFDDLAKRLDDDAPVAKPKRRVELGAAAQLVSSMTSSLS